MILIIFFNEIVHDADYIFFNAKIIAKKTQIN